MIVHDKNLLRVKKHTKYVQIKISIVELSYSDIRNGNIFDNNYLIYNILSKLYIQTSAKWGFSRHSYVQQ